MLRLGVAGGEPDEGHDVGSADARVDALMRAQVDALSGDGDRRHQAIDEIGRRPDAGEDRAVVVGIGVDVEDAHMPGERPPDGIERRRVTTLGEIRHRLEEATHRAHSIRHAKRLERASGWRPAGGDITAFGGERGYKVWPRR